MRRLLLIDHDLGDGGRLTRVLSGLGFGIDFTITAAEGRMLNDKFNYSWSVIGTPADGDNSLDLFSQLQARQQGLKGIIVETHPNLKTRRAARKAGVRIVPRPIDVNQLVPWLTAGQSEYEHAVDTHPEVLPEVPVDEQEIGKLSDEVIYNELSINELIRIIRGVEYPFAGKDRLETFDRDTLERVVMLIRRWCLSHR